MKKRLWIPVASLVTALALTACLKNDDVTTCTPNTIQKDRQVIDSFLSGSSIVAYNSDLGVYTGIIEPGTGSKATDDSLISFKYSIKMLNGTSIGSTDTLPSPKTSAGVRLGDLKNAEPVLYHFVTSVNKGGSFRVIVPSSYFSTSGVVSGGGCQQLRTNTGVNIPAYSQLIYDFILTTVKKG